MACGGFRGGVPFDPLLNYLDSEGTLAFTPVPDSPVEQLVAAYRTRLMVDRGLAAATVLRYENLERRFLGQQPATDSRQLAVDLTAADVVGYLPRESERVSVGAVKARVAELRSLLRFLHLKGLTPTALTAAVPPAAGWHDTGIPVVLSAPEVQRLLDGYDQTSPTGIHNFAIKLLRRPVESALITAALVLVHGLFRKNHDQTRAALVINRDHVDRPPTPGG